MSIRNLKGPRKIAAIALVGFGLAGVSVASAAQLTVAGSDGQDLVQAGTDSLSGDLCQTSTIDVSFTLEGAAPGDLATGGSFGYPSAVDAIVLDAIDAACDGKNISVALGTSANAEVGTEYTGTAVGGAPLTLALNGGSADFGAALGNAAIDSIAQVSVTIFD